MWWSSSITYVGCFFFFKQKTAYEMRISDWSSDVCSSDLESNAIDGVQTSLATLKAALADSADLAALVSSPIVGRTDAANAIGAVAKAMKQIGRASCRERVCQYV